MFQTLLLNLNATTQLNYRVIVFMNGNFLQS